MLHNPKWDVEVKANPFSLESLVAWLEKQPSDKEYDYCDPYGCLLCQYFRSQGFQVHSVAMNNLYRDASWKSVEFPLVLKEVSQGHDAGWTFGAALARAREALSR